MGCVAEVSAEHSPEKQSASGPSHAQCIYESIDQDQSPDDSSTSTSPAYGAPAAHTPAPKMMSPMPSNNPPVATSTLDGHALAAATLFASYSSGPTPVQNARPQLASASSWDFDALFSTMPTFPYTLPDPPPNPFLYSAGRTPPPAPPATPRPPPQVTPRARPNYLDLSAFAPSIPYNNFEPTLPSNPSRLLATAAEVLSCGAVRPDSCDDNTTSVSNQTSWQLIPSNTAGWTTYSGLENPSQDVLPLNRSTLVPADLMVAPLHQPDALACYFITPEQRQQVGLWWLTGSVTLIAVPSLLHGNSQIFGGRSHLARNKSMAVPLVSNGTWTGFWAGCSIRCPTLRYTLPRVPRHWLSDIPFPGEQERERDVHYELGAAGLGNAFVTDVSGGWRLRRRQRGSHPGDGTGYLVPRREF